MAIVNIVFQDLVVRVIGLIVVEEVVERSDEELGGEVHLVEACEIGDVGSELADLGEMGRHLVEYVLPDFPIELNELDEEDCDDFVPEPESVLVVHVLPKLVIVVLVDCVESERELGQLVEKVELLISFAERELQG